MIDFCAPRIFKSLHMGRGNVNRWSYAPDGTPIPDLRNRLPNPPPPGSRTDRTAFSGRTAILAAGQRPERCAGARGQLDHRVSSPAHVAGAPRVTTSAMAGACDREAWNRERFPGGTTRRRRSPNRGRTPPPPPAGGSPPHRPRAAASPPADRRGRWRRG